MKLKQNYISFIAILFFVVLATFSFGTKKASALTVANVMGYAWSSNIGWISFSSDNNTYSPTPTPTPTAATPKTPYQVKVRASGTMGVFEGYAWSSNIGWISFNASDIVSAGCSSSASDVATIKDFKTGEIAGWAVALAGMGRTDGWDGCIKLAGTNHLSLSTATALINGTRYNIGGVRYDPASGTIKGFAWGGNVVGWVNFDTSSLVNTESVTCKDCVKIQPVVFTATCTTSSAVSGVAPLTVTFTANPNPSTGTYSYTWYPIGQNSVMPGGTKTVTYTYSTPGTYNPIVLIADTTIDPNNQYAASCPAITVTAPPATQTLNLYLVPNVSSPTTAPNTTQLSSARSAPADNVITMRRGSVALMGLDIPGYSGCTPFNAGGATSWNKIFPSQDVQELISNNLEIGNYVNVDTSVLNSNVVYTARIQCINSTTQDVEFDSVKLKVTSTCKDCVKIQPVVFTATCTTSSAVSGVAPLTVTFTANPNPSTGTYSYTWYPIGQNSVMPGGTKTVTYTYSTPGTYNPIVLIADTTIDPNNQYAASCPAITVTAPPATQTLNLYLVPNVSSPTTAPNTTQLSSARSAPADNVITMRRGSVALMGLDIPGYSGCTPFNAGGATSWNKIFPSQDVQELISNNLEIGNYVNVDTSVLNSNVVYTARIQCINSTTQDVEFDSVKLKVTSSNLKEF